MAGLQRSAVSFRRQGSSGLIWDDKLFSGDLKRNSKGNPPLSDDGNHNQNQNQTAGGNESNDQSKCSKTAIGSINTVRRSRSNNGGGGTEPPSPRVPVCGFCSAFGKTNKNQRRIASRKRSFA